MTATPGASDHQQVARTLNWRFHVEAVRSPSASPRDQLIREHTDVARRIAHRIARRCPTWIAREDLVAAGTLGLIEAADRFDDTRGEPFLSFAEHRIRGAILDELRRGDIMPRRVRQRARKIEAAIAALEQRGEPANEQQVAAAIGVSVEDYRAGLSGLVQVVLEPLDAADRVAMDDEHAPDVLADQHHALDRVRIAMASMEPRDAKILAMYYVEDLTYQEIAEALHITSSRVCQLLWRAVTRLRELVEGVRAQRAYRSSDLKEVAHQSPPHQLARKAA